MPRTIRVLIIEDSETDAALVTRFLTRQGYNLISRREETAAGFEAALSEQEWDLIISDYILPSFSGLEVLKALRERKITIPCIITSGRIDEETATAAMRAGARDYVMKDNLKRLGPAVERELEEAELRRKGEENLKIKRLTEEQLAESQKRLALAVQASGGGVFEYSGGPQPSYFLDEAIAKITGYQLSELPRPDRFVYWLMSQIHSEDLNSVLDTYEKFLAEPVKRYSVEFRFRHKIGHWIYLRCVAQGTLTGPAGESRLNGIVQDITESKQNERRILLVNQVLQIYWQAASRKEYLAKVVQTLKEWTGCECLGIRILDEEKGTIPYEAQVGFGKDFLKTEDMLALHGDECACIRVVAGRSEPQDQAAMTQGGSFTLANSLSFITDLEPEEQKRFRGVCVRCGYLTIAVVPLRYRQEVLGAVHIADKSPAALSIQEIETLEAAAEIVGQGIYRFEISENLKKAEDRLRALSRRLVEVQEDERRSIARELHDEVGQSLTALKMLVAQAMRGQQGSNQPSLSEAFSVVTDLMKQVREMSLDLRPSMLDDLGLLPALLWQFQRFSGQTGIKINFHHEGLENALPSEINTAVFRVIQEAMTNIVRHAGVGEANVSVVARNGVLSILVEDKGRGFDFEDLEAGNSAGLSGMRERVLLLRGKLKLDSAPGRGTTVRVQLPLPGAKETVESAK